MVCVDEGFLCLVIGWFIGVWLSYGCGYHMGVVSSASLKNPLAEILCNAVYTALVCIFANLTQELSHMMNT